VFGGLSGKKENGWLAVVPRAGRIDVARVARRRDSLPAVLQMDSWEPGASLGDSIKALVAARKLRNCRATTLLEAGRYHLAQFELPPVPPAERAEALRWRFKDAVDFPLETASVGVLDIPLEGNAARQPMVYAVAAGQTAVQPLMAAFADGKLPLEAIDIPELAQRNVAALFEPENRGLAFLTLDESGGLLTVTYRDELYAVRRIEVSAVQLAEAVPERRDALQERVMLEVQRTLDNFDRQYSFISVAALLVTSSPTVDGLVVCLADNLYVPVKAADLGEVLDFSAVPELRGNPALQARYLPALGAALRSEAPA